MNRIGVGLVVTHAALNGVQGAKDDDLFQRLALTVTNAVVSTFGILIGLVIVPNMPDLVEFSLVRQPHHSPPEVDNSLVIDRFATDLSTPKPVT